MRLMLLLVPLLLCSCSFLKENVRVEMGNDDYREYQESRTWDEQDADKQRADEIHSHVSGKE